MLLANGRFLSWASQGMETSLGFLLVAIGLASVLVGRRSPLVLGVLAGLCVLHKLDLAGFALALIAFARPADSTVPEFSKGGLRAKSVAAVIAILILLVYVVWAEVRFGSPLPLSVARKIGREHGAVDTTWFIRAALFRDGGNWYCILALVGIWRLHTQALAGVAWLALAHIGSHVVAYTVLPPAERYSWYPVQLQPSLSLLAGIGLFSLTEWCAQRSSRSPATARAMVWMIPLVVGIRLWTVNDGYRGAQRDWGNRIETHRIAAGRWLAENTPADARIATGFGLIAFYCQRTVLDWSGLTRPYIPLDDFFRTTDPDFIGICRYGGDVTPATYRPPSGYRVVESFGPSLTRDHQPTFFALVLEREP